MVSMVSRQAEHRNASSREEMRGPGWFNFQLLNLFHNQVLHQMAEIRDHETQVVQMVASS
jgi:hypothetical protein